MKGERLLYIASPGRVECIPHVNCHREYHSTVFRSIDSFYLDGMNRGSSWTESILSRWEFTSSLKCQSWPHPDELLEHFLAASNSVLDDRIRGARGHLSSCWSELVAQLSSAQGRHLNTPHVEHEAEGTPSVPHLVSNWHLDPTSKRHHSYVYS